MSGEGLPVISGAEAVKAFVKAGWTARSQAGSHISMTKPGVAVNLSVPQHKQLDRGLLRALIRKSGLTVEQFKALL